MTAGQWDQEEREGAITISPGGDFNVEFLCQDEGYKASLDIRLVKKWEWVWYWFVWYMPEKTILGTAQVLNKRLGSC